jgi:FKBP-type peptidyl-prolyl cis-trans isomerase
MRLVCLLIVAFLVPFSGLAQSSMIPKAPEEVGAVPADAIQSITGLASRVLRAGTGKVRPSVESVVTVHYTGWKTDGTVIDSSFSRGEPTTFPLKQVIKGWTEGLQLMVEGEVRRLWVPARLAYADRAGAPQGMLVFDVELLKFTEPPSSPKAPSDVADIPADSQISATGLASKRLRQGTGKRYPRSTQTVTVHYTGWTTDGKPFDSSVTRGKPASFALNQVIAGWTEGLRLMVVGEKRRFWIPQKLAYQGRPGAPAGMLVFDVELLDIK